MKGTIAIIIDGHASDKQLSGWKRQLQDFFRASAPECYDTLLTGILLCWRKGEDGHGMTTGDADKQVMAMLRGLWPAPYSLDSRI